MGRARRYVCPGDSSIHPQGGEIRRRQKRHLRKKVEVLAYAYRVAWLAPMTYYHSPFASPLRVHGGLEELGAGIGGLHPLSGARELRRAVDAAASQDVMMVMMVSAPASVASCT